jgi:hypothetical protein
VKTAKYPEKIAALWTTFLLGTLFHTQLGLMPLFHWSIDRLRVSKPAISIRFSGECCSFFASNVSDYRGQF